VTVYSNAVFRFLSVGSPIKQSCHRFVSKLFLTVKRPEAWSFSPNPKKLVCNKYDTQIGEVKLDLTIDLTSVRRNDIVGPNHFNDSFIIMTTCWFLAVRSYSGKHRDGALSFKRSYGNYLGDRGSTVAKLLCYKSEGRWFDSRCRHWKFSLI